MPAPTPERPPAPPPPRRRRWPRRIALLVGTAVVAALAIEIGFHIADVYRPMVFSRPGENEDRQHEFFETDPVVGWRMKPGLEFTIDDEGGVVQFRADAHGRRVGPDTRAAANTDTNATPPRHTVVLAGGSFVWGAGVLYEDSLAGLLEQRYPGVHTENLAQPGFGLDQIMLSVVKQGLPLRPDLIVVGIYPMDLHRSHDAFRQDFGFHKPTFRVEGGRLVPMTERDRPGAVFSWLEHNSRLLGLWRRATRNVGMTHGLGSWWSLNEAILDELLRNVRAQGCPLLLVHIPLHAWRPCGGLTKWCAEHGVALIDPVAVDAAAPADIYYPPEGHLTPKGQRYIARLVTDWIDAQNLPLSR